MSREQQPWGGDLQVPGWIRRLVHRPAPTDTPERAHERRKPEYPDMSVIENADRAIFGAWSEGHPGNKPHEH
ncbi:MAG: hypothetical protein M3P44_08285 [Actinomycetota bacterium]|nr:hypothetical protein [Actinomycetota bacterium]